MTETYPQNRLIGYARVSTYGQTSTPSLSSFAPQDAATGTFTVKRLQARGPTGASF